MTPRRVRFTATAQQHVRREKAWWLENRVHTELFADELEAALPLVGVLPGAGTSYTRAEIAGVRRWYLPKVACHLYYTFDEHEVMVRVVGCSPRAGATYQTVAHAQEFVRPTAGR